jgi:hypothetical protein
MKKFFLFIVTLFFLFTSASLTANGSRGYTGSQDSNQDTIVEKVTVTNIEVPVRVVRKGIPVNTLTKDDFTLYENKKKMEINGFFLKRKKLKVDTQKTVGVDAPLPPPRTFILSFSVTDFNVHLVKAVNHLFDNVLKANDRVLVFANNKTNEFQNIKNKEAIKKQLLEVLKEESKEARLRLVKYINLVETYINLSNIKLDFDVTEKPSVKIHNFMKKYDRVWNDYKKKYLIPNKDRFYFFSRYLEKVKGEKWVLNFYQFDLFPKIRMNNSVSNYIRDIATGLIHSRDAGDQAIGKAVQILLDKLLVDMVLGKGYPYEEIAKLFYKVDATFHSFFIRSMSKANVNDMDYIEVASDIEKTLKKITDITGGQNITSNDLVQSIDTVSTYEDAYYVLSYVPANPDKAGKLKIKVKGKKGKGCKVLYDDNFNADYITEYFERMEQKIKTPDIKITDFSFKGKVLAFTVRDYIMMPSKSGDGQKVGQMKIRICLTTKVDRKKVFDQSKTLTAQKAEMKISLGAFKKIQKGAYSFQIEASDLYTGKEDSVHYDIEVKR